MSQVADLSPDAVNPLLTTGRIGRDYRFLPSCRSTNDEVAACAADGAREGLLVAADAQTAGRGRRGRTWHSPPGENLYCSLLLRPALPARELAPLTLLAGVAVARALVALGIEPRLKWPNDVLLDTRAGLRKVAGILTEMASEGERVRRVVLGLGVDVNGCDFPGALAPVATSVRLACGRPVERAAVLAGFLNAFEPLYDRLLAEGPATAIAEWTRHGILGYACWIQRDGRRLEGTAEAVDASGALLLRTTSAQVVAVHAGEVNWR